MLKLRAELQPDFLLIHKFGELEYPIIMTFFLGSEYWYRVADKQHGKCSFYGIQVNPISFKDSCWLSSVKW